MEMRSSGATHGFDRRASAVAGFTLIEVMIAMVLFSVVLIAAGGMMMSLARGTAYSSTRTHTAFHMQQNIERFRNLDYSALTSGTADTTLANGARIRAEWTVSQVVPDRLAQIDLSVYRVPLGPGGRLRAVRLFIANRDP